MYDYLLIFLSVMGHLLQYFDLYFDIAPVSVLPLGKWDCFAS